MNKKYQVFISSTYEDLQKERKKAQEAILDLECFPAGMEIFPAVDMEQFEYIKKVMDLSDYVVIISGNKYGTLAEEGISYTEKEFWYAKEKNIPIIAFLNSNFMEIESEEKIGLLKEFRNELKKERIVKFWNTEEELKTQIIVGLHKMFEIHEMPGWVRGGEQDKYKAPRIFYGKDEPKDMQDGDIWIAECE